MTGLDVAFFDLDGTLLEGTAFQAVAEGQGPGCADVVEAIDERFFAGEITLEECFWETWDHLEGLEAEACREHLRQAPGVGSWEEAVEALHEAGLAVGILTDQPDVLAEAFAVAGVDHVLASPTEVADGRITGEIDARFDKRAHLEAFLDEEGIDPVRVGHVGNGRNDVPVFEVVGRAVAANPDDGEVARAADDVVDPFVDATDAVEALLGGD